MAARISPRKLALFVVSGLALCVAAAPAQPRLERVPAKAISSMEGHAIYEANCAACHGRAGRGDGPAALVLSTPVPDLTRLAVRDGRFDELHVRNHIAGTGAEPVIEMIAWERVFRRLYGSPAYEVALLNVTDHIRRLQVTP